MDAIFCCTLLVQQLYSLNLTAEAQKPIGCSTGRFSHRQLSLAQIIPGKNPMRIYMNWLQLALLYLARSLVHSLLFFGLYTMTIAICERNKKALEWWKDFIGTTSKITTQHGSNFLQSLKISQNEVENTSQYKSRLQTAYRNNDLGTVNEPKNRRKHWMKQ